MENTITKTKEKVNYTTLLTCLLMTLFDALIFYFLMNISNFSFNTSTEIQFALNKTIILWLTASMIFALGSASFMQLSVSATQETLGVKLNLILFYCGLFFVLLWALFCFSLKLPTAGLIMLSIATAIFIFSCYRFSTRSIISGIILTAFTLWLMYLIYLNFSFLLVRQLG